MTERESLVARLVMLAGMTAELLANAGIKIENSGAELIEFLNGGSDEFLRSMVELYADVAGGDSDKRFSVIQAEQQPDYDLGE